MVGYSWLVVLKVGFLVVQSWFAGCFLSVCWLFNGFIGYFMLFCLVSTELEKAPPSAPLRCTEIFF